MRLALCALLILGPAIADAQSQWVPLARLGAPELEADTASSRRHDQHLDVWIRQTYPEPQQVATPSKAVAVYQRSLGKWSIDCSSRRYRVSQIIYHSADGRVVNNVGGNEDAIAWQAPVAETIGEIAVDSVCASRSLFDGTYTTALTAYRDRMQQIDSIRAAACAAEHPATIVANCKRLAAVKGSTSQVGSERWVLQSQIDALLELEWPAFPSRRTP